jgi:hypothetical protein
LGKPRIEFIFNLVQVPLLLTGIFIGIKYGIVGVAIAVSLVVGMMALVFMKLSVGLIGLKGRNIFGALYPAFLSSLLMLILVLLVRYLLIDLGYKNYQVLIVCIPFGVVVYFLALLTFFRECFHMLLNLFMDIAGHRFTRIMKKALV